jgi:flagellar basal-body rod protein FlgG
MRALDIGATGMQAQQLNVEVIANNIANVSTTGYKRQRAEFQDLLYQTVVRPGAQSSDVGTIVPSGIQLGAGVKAGAIYRINEQGNIQQTSNQLDLAINGSGYFEVEMPDGETAYTRDGSFQLNQNGQIVTADGYLVKPGISLPNDTTGITINASGDVYATEQGKTTPSQVGQFELSTFANPNGLDAQGSNLFLQTAASGSPITGKAQTNGFGSLIQGSVETSNVDIVSEITNLITAQRAYEMNSKVIKTTDDMLTTVGQMKS